jgi:hypothetical protein
MCGRAHLDLLGHRFLRAPRERDAPVVGPRVPVQVQAAAQAAEPTRPTSGGVICTPAASPWLQGQPESVLSNVRQGWQPGACRTHAASRRGGHRLHMIFLFQLSPKWGMNPLILTINRYDGNVHAPGGAGGHFYCGGS